MADSNIHVGQGGSRHKLRRVLIGVGAALLVAVVSLAAGAGMRWWQQQREYSRLSKPEAVSKEATEAQDLTLRGDFDKAHDTINKALDNPKLSSDAKYELFMQQGGAYEGQEKNDKAMESYRQAESLKETQIVTEAIARLAEAKGDKELAIRYYQKAISLIPSDDVMKDGTKKYYEDQIFVLQGGVIKDE